MNHSYRRRPHGRVRINDRPEIIDQYYGSQRRPPSGIATSAPYARNTSQKPSNTSDKTAPHSPYPQGTTRLHSSIYRQRPLPDRPEEVNPLDHRIGTHGGTTSNLEYLPHRLKVNKHPVSSEDRIRDLTRENGYLRQELALHKDIRRTLLELKEKTEKAQFYLHDALQDASSKMARGEQRLLDYWGIHHNDGSQETKMF